MRLSRSVSAVVVVLLVATSFVLAKSKDDPTQVSSTDFVVLKDDSGKPVRNAAVILHPVSKNGKQGKAGFELKTDADGKTHFDGVPYGLLRAQVIAHGYQTFGDDFQINQQEQQITIRLKTPQGQYSIYENHDGGQVGGSSSGSGTSTPSGSGTSTPQQAPPPQKQ